MSAGGRKLTPDPSVMRSTRVASHSWIRASSNFQRGRTSISFTRSTPEGARQAPAGRQQVSRLARAEQVQHVGEDDRVPRIRRPTRPAPEREQAKPGPRRPPAAAILPASTSRAPPAPCAPWASRIERRAVPAADVEDRPRRRTVPSRARRAGRTGPDVQPHAAGLAVVGGRGPAHERRSTSRHSDRRRCRAGNRGGPRRRGPPSTAGPRARRPTRSPTRTGPGRRRPAPPGAWPARPTPRPSPQPVDGRDEPLALEVAGFVEPRRRGRPPEPGARWLGARTADRACSRPRARPVSGRWTG